MSEIFRIIDAFDLNDKIEVIITTHIKIKDINDEKKASCLECDNRNKKKPEINEHVHCDKMMCYMRKYRNTCHFFKKKIEKIRGLDRWKK